MVAIERILDYATAQESNGDTVSVSVDGELAGRAITGFSARRITMLDALRVLCDSNGLMLMTNYDNLFILDKTPPYLRTYGELDIE